MPRLTDGQKVSLLQRLVTYLKDSFLIQNDFTPRTLDQLLQETYNKDIFPTMKLWLKDIGLRRVDQIEAVGDGYVYKPPLPCRDKDSLRDLLLMCDREGPKGILRDNIIDSIPGDAEAVIQSLTEEMGIVSIVRGDKKDLLFLADNSCLMVLDDADIELWKSLDFGEDDDREVEVHLGELGLRAERHRFKRRQKIKKELLEEVRLPSASDMEIDPPSVVPVIHIKCNTHVMPALLNFNWLQGTKDKIGKIKTKK